MLLLIGSLDLFYLEINMLTLVIVPNKLLRQKASEVSFPLNQELLNLMPKFTAAMIRYDGIGLAGPQVGLNIRVITISIEQQTKVFFNPRILRFSWRKNKIEEGCLSVPGVFGVVKRPQSILASYQDINGQIITERMTGLLARVYQHEVDHLNGVLFTDKVLSISQGQELLKQYDKF